MAKTIYDFTAKTINGQDVSLSDWRGKTLLIVNVASQCGLTPQYQGLEALQQKFKAQGFEVLGFPCNQFGAQEPGSEQDIADFCDINFKVSFPMFAKIEVNGPGAHPLFGFLKEERPGILGSEAIKWNFTKFLVDKNGCVLKRFAPTDTPASLEKHIEKQLTP